MTTLSTVSDLSGIGARSDGDKGSCIHEDGGLCKPLVASSPSECTLVIKQVFVIGTPQESNSAPAHIRSWWIMNEIVRWSLLFSLLQVGCYDLDCVATCEVINIPLLHVA
jgi:hypothetical protein